MDIISVFGISANVTASSTFPNGFKVTSFADDADPLDTPDLEIADTAMGPNGNFIVWSRPQGIEITLNVIPASVDDTNLSVLHEANRVGEGKSSAADTVHIVVSYPDKSTASLADGVMISGPVVKKGTAQGRMKTNMYRFRFGTITKTNTAPSA